MSTALDQALDDYLGLHRSLGRKYVDHGIQLPQFVAYLEAAGATTVTTDLAVAWAIQPTGSTPVWWARRLTMVRGFARYLKALDPDTEIPLSRAAALPGQPCRSLSVLRRRYRGADGGRPDLAPAAAGRHLRDPHRAHRRHRDALGGGGASRPRRRRLGRGGDHDMAIEVRQEPSPACPSHHAGRAGPLRRFPRRVHSQTPGADLLRLHRRHPAQQRRRQDLPPLGAPGRPDQPLGASPAAARSASPLRGGHPRQLVSRRRRRRSPHAAAVHIYGSRQPAGHVLVLVGCPRAAVAGRPTPRTAREAARS